MAVAWLREEPFSKEFVQFYNQFSHFWVNPNEEFKKRIKAIERELSREFGSQIPKSVKSAFYAYRRALYEYFRAEAEARAVAPPISVVGRSKYSGKPARAEKIMERATRKLERVENWLESAISKEKHKKTVGKVEKETSLTLNELKGQKLKRDLKLDSAIKSWHNKHKDGSGTFGFMLTKGTKWVRLAGSYTPTGKVYNLTIETAQHAPKSISAKSYEGLIGQLGKLFGVSVTTTEAGKKRSNAKKKKEKIKISEIMAKVRKGKKLTKQEREYMSRFMRQVRRKKREELSKKYAKLSKKELEAMFAKRNKRSRSVDKRKRAKKVITKPEEYYLWVRNPRRYDILGIDTP